MPTFYSDHVASGVQARAGTGVNCVVATCAVPNTLAAADILEMVRIPVGATIIDVLLSSTDIETHGTPAILLEVGDDGDTDRFIAGSTAGQAGTITKISNIAGVGYKYTANNTIDVKVATVASTPAAGTVKLVVTYHMAEFN